MVKINFLQFSPDLSNFLQLKPFLFAGEDFLNFILRICQPWGWVLVPTKIGSAQVLSALTCLLLQKYEYQWLIELTWGSPDVVHLIKFASSFSISALLGVSIGCPTKIYCMQDSKQKNEVKDTYPSKKSKNKHQKMST